MLQTNKQIEGSGHGLIWGTMLAKIWTGCIQNTSQNIGT